MKVGCIKLWQCVALGIVVALALTGSYAVYAALWGTSVVLHQPYDQAERRLFTTLNLDKKSLVATTQAPSTVSGELKKSLAMGIHTQRLLDYVPGERIHFRGDHAYNIWGTGQESIEIDLAKKDENSCTITVDYFEIAWLMDFIPVSVQFGRDQERQIIAVVFGEEVVD